MAPLLVKYNWMFPWNQTANGFQFLKSPTQFPEELTFRAKRKPINHANYRGNAWQIHIFLCMAGNACRVVLIKSRSISRVRKIVLSEGTLPTRSRAFTI